MSSVCFSTLDNFVFRGVSFIPCAYLESRSRRGVISKRPCSWKDIHLSRVSIFPTSCTSLILPLIPVGGYATRNNCYSTTGTLQLNPRGCIRDFVIGFSKREATAKASTPSSASAGFPLQWKSSITRSLVAGLGSAGGSLALPQLARFLATLVGPRASNHVNVLITGTFMPVVGILFAMLSSIAVSALRQRQQDLRDLLHQELALIRMLLVMIKDESLIRLLLKYTLQLELETFSHKKNGISYDHEVPGTHAAIRREEVFAESEETLWKCFTISNDLRLRSEVEGAIRTLVTFRTKRRAVLDSGLPEIHFIIVTLLGASMLLAFGLIVSNDVLLADLMAVRTLFGILLGLLSMTYNLISDLRNPFGGEYGVTPWRLYRTVELLELRLEEFTQSQGSPVLD